MIRFIKWLFRCRHRGMLLGYWPELARTSEGVHYLRTITGRCPKCGEVADTRHYTIDGRRPAPHPGMTDDDLRDYESMFNVPGGAR